MSLLVISFLAGILTVLAPCILPVLPVIIGGAVAGHKPRNPYIITASLAVAVVTFTLLLKFSTAFINVSPSVWNSISGILIIFFGLISCFPAIWEKISMTLNLQGVTTKNLSAAGQKSGFWGDVLLGAALGPVFSSCSPTYFVILASVLPTSFMIGFVYLSAYALGLSIALLAIALLGAHLVRKVASLSNPHGPFKKILGVIFILVGLFIITGYDKYLQTYLLARGLYPASGLEMQLLEKTNPAASPNSPRASPVPTPQVEKNYPRFRDIVSPSGFINSMPFKISDLVGTKVILVDFMTYTCINCIRTFPYLNAWYDKYRADGLEIVGIHTPEFAFEKKYENVKKALAGYGIQFPIVLDNDYATWQNYQNSYWPRKYLIDIDGYIVYDHIGEGKYDETELKIQELLDEAMRREELAGAKSIPVGLVAPTDADTPKAKSPETYFGAARNEYLANGKKRSIGVQTFNRPTTAFPNDLNLVGDWNVTSESAQNVSANSSIIYRYNAEDVYLVAKATQPITVEITRDDAPLTDKTAGFDVFFANGKSYVTIQFDRLYNLVKESAGVGIHTLEIIIPAPGLEAFAFTFG